ncbi:MAG: acyltransferase family protein [Novosphingobium sp.]
MPDQPPASIQRHYGLDWLRIWAFALLILYHLGLYFAPGHWIVKSPQIAQWTAWPLAAIVPWRLSVLFAVSGFATAAMIQRFPSLPAFLAERSKRLLIPLLFGMLVIVPPQEWVRVEVGGADPAFASFLGHDAFSFATHGGVFMPGWEHLWFLPYLWAYTVLLAALVAFVPHWRSRAATLATWLARGSRLIWLPAAAMAGAMAVLSRIHIQGLTDSADYIPAFLIGFAYAHVPALRDAFSRYFALAVGASLAALGGLWGLIALDSPSPGIAEQALGLAASSLMSWAMIPVAFHLADRFLNRDHRWRQPLATAVFPAYIVHQTVIVVTGWQLRQAGVVGMPAFLIQLAAVMTGCLAAWLLARHVPLVGILLGMPPKRQRGQTAVQRLAPT